MIRAAPDLLQHGKRPSCRRAAQPSNDPAKSFGDELRPTDPIERNYTRPSRRVGEKENDRRYGSGTSTALNGSSTPRSSGYSSIPSKQKRPTGVRPGYAPVPRVDTSTLSFAIQSCLRQYDIRNRRGPASEHSPRPPAVRSSANTRQTPYTPVETHLVFGNYTKKDIPSRAW